MATSGFRYLRILDGSMGDLLLKRGLPDDKLSWSARAILDDKYHFMVTQCHLDYLYSGSTIITTNNYALKPVALEHINQQQNIPTLTSTAVNLAMNARNAFYKKNPSQKDMIRIAGSLPPLHASYRPDTIYSDAECKYWYQLIVNALHESNVDIFLCETMSCLTECQYALDVLENMNTFKKCWISFTLNEQGLLRSNENLNDVIKQLISTKYDFVNKNIEIIGINCCTPESIDKALKMLNDESIQLLKEFDINIGVYANGWDELPNNWTFGSYQNPKARKILTPEYYYNNYVKRWLLQYPYIGMIGGCCAIYPAHIEYMVNSIKKDLPQISFSEMISDPIQ